MSLGLAIALYIVIWWTVLFAVLPFGVKSQSETDAVVGGTEPGAPTAPRLWLKALITTVIAAAVFVVAYWAIVTIEL
jgi:predicted secreted protein